VGPPGIRSYAGVPLQTPDGYNIGALCIIDTKPRRFDEAQVAILNSFASLVVDELELRRIAERDHLTGALTRRGFILQMEQAMARFRRYQSDSLLLLLDIDHFKKVNDQNGHPAGDAVLKAVTEVCQQQMRANDSFGRLGGEEFGILLSETDKDVALAAAEKFRQGIEDLVIDVGVKLNVTASFGIAALTSATSKPEEWVARADEALYFAKRQGRNRCVLAGENAASIAA
jgi:diguanylate cyclase (GGDEF)-like protein